MRRRRVPAVVAVVVAVVAVVAAAAAAVLVALRVGTPPSTTGVFLRASLRAKVTRKGFCRSFFFLTAFFFKTEFRRILLGFRISLQLDRYCTELDWVDWVLFDLNRFW